MAENTEHIDLITKTIIDLLVEEFVAQGHHLTGAFEKNIISEKIIESANNVLIKIYGSKYAIYLENGVAPGKIPFTPKGWPTASTGKKTSKYIEALKAYVQLRMNIFEVTKQTSIAFAIARKQKEQGNPTYASYKFSKTNYRKNFITDTMWKFLASKTPEQIIFDNMEGKIENIIKQRK